MAAIMLRHGILGYIPRVHSGTCAGTDHFESRSDGRIGSIPKPTQEGLVVGKDDHLADSFKEASNFLHRRECPMVVEA
jgi:hypothetical protein